MTVNELEGRVVIVTGGARGMGAADALALGQAGASVAVADVLEGEAEQVAGRIASGGGTASALRLDVTSEADWQDAVRATEERFGRLDGLVNNAGVSYRVGIEKGDLDDWHRMIDVNVNGVLTSTHAALPHLVKAATGERGIADVVTISSIAGR